MDKLEEVMPPAEGKEIKEQEIEEEAEEADGAAGKDDAEEEDAAAGKDDAVDEEEEEEASAGKDDAVDEEEEEEASAGKDDAVDEEEQQEAAAAGKDDAADEVKEDKEEADGNEQRSGDKPKDKAIPQAAKKRAKNLPWQDKPKEKRPDECLNLNNEVVRMRKEVKRVRALVIRKLTRQMAALKKRKGKELAVESNQRRAGRLLEEIHAMKTLPTDLVSKTALQRNLNFDQVCKNPRSTILDRALARIATHRQFNKKIQDIKAAVKAFKEERVKGVKQVGKEKVQIKGVTVNLQSPEKNVEREKEERDITVEQKEDKEKGDDLLKDITVAEPKKKTGKASLVVSQRKEMPQARNVRLASIKGSDENNVVKDKPQAKQAGKKPDLKSLPQVLQKKDEEESDLESDDVEEDEPQAKNQPDLKSEPTVLQKKMDEEEESDLESDDGEEDEPQSEKKPDVKSAPKVLQKNRDEEEESDLESDGVEKEYFDDSTEERFHKKSSQSEESDDDNGFFVGKVRKFSKKKKKKNSDEEDTASEWREVTSSDKVQGELDELESRLKSKATSFQSVFCSSLSSSKPRGGRGRGGDGFRGRGRPNDGGGQDRDFSKPKFQKQERESFSSGGRGRGRGRGRGDGMRQNDRRAGGGSSFTQHAPEQALHPSWEASKKRKEQQGQILAFQGKKIKFDIDD
ncbi:serum response factor-binding protein 1 [Clinocottus analis]|uniref:serum response factor-binding protein 1 n=1 Tax=Clinocottus analis TaxID=304258 RepID=UPI0035C07066